MLKFNLKKLSKTEQLENYYKKLPSGQFIIKKLGTRIFLYTKILTFKFIYVIILKVKHKK